MLQTHANIFYVCAILGQGVGGICAPTLVSHPAHIHFSLEFHVSLAHVMPNPSRLMTAP